MPCAQNPQVSLTIDAPAEVTVDGTHATPDVPTTVTATNTGNVTLTNLQLTSHDGNALVWDGNGTALAPGETVTGTAVIPASGLTSSDDKDADVVATVRGQCNELTAEDSDAGTVTIVRAPSKPATDEPGSDTGAGGSGTTGGDSGEHGTTGDTGEKTDPEGTVNAGAEQAAANGAKSPTATGAKRSTSASAARSESRSSKMPETDDPAVDAGAVAFVAGGIALGGWALRRREA